MLQKRYNRAVRKSVFLNILFLLLFIFIASSVVNARSGCCSWHGGVCGCGCCDGTPLSSTCAPYYPECSGGNTYSIPTLTPSCPLMSYYDSLSNSCKCYSGYIASGNQCISQDQACKNQYGYNSQTNYAGSCECIYGYVWDDSGTSCISGNQYCWNKYGYSSTYESWNKSCKCITGYHFEGSQCVLDIPEDMPAVQGVYTYPTETTYIPQPTVTQSPPTPTNAPTLTPTPIPTKNNVLGAETKNPTPTITIQSATDSNAGGELLGLLILGGGGYWLYKRKKKSSQPTQTTQNP